MDKYNEKKYNKNNKDTQKNKKALKNKKQQKISNYLINKDKKKEEDKKIKELRIMLFKAFKVHNPTVGGLLSNINKTPDEIHLNTRCSSPN